MNLHQEPEKKAPQKTKEDLEREKKASLASRMPQMPELGSLSGEALREKAKELHEQIWNVVSNMYNMMERYKRQQYEVGGCKLIKYWRYVRSHSSVSV